MKTESKEVESRAHEIAAELDLLLRWMEKPNRFIVKEGFELLSRKTGKVVAGDPFLMTAEQVIAYCERQLADRREKKAQREAKAWREHQRRGLIGGAGASSPRTRKGERHE